MIDLSRRSYQKELMDGEDVPFAAMAQTLRELNVINTRLGGHAITLRGVKRIIQHSSPDNYRDAIPLPKVIGTQFTICEIGCGGGDNLFAVYKYCSSKNIPVRFIGIDMNAECIAFARQQYPQLNCQWICSDYAIADLSQMQPDVIFSSLFCHHFTDEQLVSMLQWLLQNTRIGFFINDLHRHWLAYYLIKYITRFFSRSYLVRNDACISVARSFRKQDWMRLFEKAGISHQSAVRSQPVISWQWAFRFLVTYRK
jgi:2-polyprenyl-3-methyl-5-hydroxy-6-metoxy-1,4-benzoquinol methylase